MSHPQQDPALRAARLTGVIERLVDEIRYLRRRQARSPYTKAALSALDGIENPAALPKVLELAGRAWNECSCDPADGDCVHEELYAALRALHETEGEGA